jgi:hypothetical protein
MVLLRIRWGCRSRLGAPPAVGSISMLLIKVNFSFPGFKWGWLLYPNPFYPYLLFTTSDFWVKIVRL